MPWDNARPGTNPIYRTRAHRDARARMLEQFKPGDPCCLCGEPMYPPTSQLHADHDPDGGYRGLAHAACNVRDGAQRGRARQEETQLKWLQSEAAPQPWLTQDNHPCPVCSTPVLWATQRCCSRACAVELRRRNKTEPQPVQHACQLCGHRFTGRKRRYCSDACMWEANARLSRDRYRAREGLAVDRSRPTKPSRPRPEGAVL